MVRERPYFFFEPSPRLCELVVNTCDNLRPCIAVGLNVRGNAKAVFQNNFLRGISDTLALSEFSACLPPDNPLESCPCSDRWKGSIESVANIF